MLWPAGGSPVAAASVPPAAVEAAPTMEAATAVETSTPAPAVETTATAVETTAPAPAVSVGGIWLAERGNA